MRPVVNWILRPSNIFLHGPNSADEPTSLHCLLSTIITSFGWKQSRNFFFFLALKEKLHRVSNYLKVNIHNLGRQNRKEQMASFVDLLPKPI